MNAVLNRTTRLRLWQGITFFCLLTLAATVLAQAKRLAEYRFDDVAWCLPVQAKDTQGTYNSQEITSGILSATTATTGAAAGFFGGAIDINNLPLDTTLNGTTSVSFWMYWDGMDSIMPFGFEHYDLWLKQGSFGFNTFNSDLYGISAEGLKNGWHHVAAVFTNGDVKQNILWIDGQQQILTDRLGSSPNNSNAHVKNQRVRIGGTRGDGNYRFSGKLDEVRIYRGTLTTQQVSADMLATSSAPTCPPPPPPQLKAHYRLDTWNTTSSSSATLENAVSGGSPATINGALPGRAEAGSTATGKADTCYAASMSVSTAPILASADLDLLGGGKNSVSFWMYWEGGNSQMPFGFNRYDLWLVDGYFGFNTGNSDLYGISSKALASGWHHVAAVFTNGSVLGNQLWIDGQAQVLTQKFGAPNTQSAYATQQFRFSGWGGDNNYHFGGMLDELKVYRGALDEKTVQQDFAASCRDIPPPVSSTDFDCTTTPTNNRLYTQVVGKPFDMYVRALNTTYAQAAAKTVTVELVDASNWGAQDSCSTRPPVVSSQSVTFAKGQTALPKVLFTLPEARRNLRCRVTEQGLPTDKATAPSCSSDNFAVRPASLKATELIGQQVKAGREFQLTVEGGPGYDGQPQLRIFEDITTASLGNLNTTQFPAAEKGIASGTFTYSEVGYLRWNAFDNAFTAVDQQSGDCIPGSTQNERTDGRFGCNFEEAGKKSLARFVPDHFAVSESSFTPGCPSDGFSYMDQGFKLQATVEARNAAGQTTKNYDVRHVIDDGTLKLNYAAGMVDVLLKDNTGSTILSAPSRLVLQRTLWKEGQYLLTITRFKRGDTPDGPYDALDIGLAVRDSTAANTTMLQRDMNAATSDCRTDLTGQSSARDVCTGTRIVQGTKMRFGRLAMSNAYGSERLPLPLPLTAQYWNGQGFIQNPLDNCTQLKTENVIVPARGTSNTLGMVHPQISVTPMVKGKGSLLLNAPGAAGSVDLSLFLVRGAVANNCLSLTSTGSITSAQIPWLRGQWCGNAHDRFPTARATFGLYKSSLIQRRENY